MVHPLLTHTNTVPLDSFSPFRSILLSLPIPTEYLFQCLLSNIYFHRPSATVLSITPFYVRKLYINSLLVMLSLVFDTCKGLRLTFLTFMIISWDCVFIVKGPVTPYSVCLTVLCNPFRSYFRSVEVFLSPGLYHTSF